MMSAKKDETQQQGAGNRQGGSADHQGQSGIHSNFAHASPESNVNRPGRPQSGAGSIASDSGAEVPGGVTSQIEASRNAQAGSGGSSAGRNSGPTPEDAPADDGHSVVNSSGGAGMDRDS
jgi:hypothetical protein